MKYISFLLLLTFLISITSCKYFKEHPLFSNDVDSLVDLNEYAEEPVVAEDTFTLIEVVDETEPEVQSETVQPVSMQTGYGNDRYYMIVGSFENENYAAIYAEKLQSQGYSTQIFQATNGLYRVSAKSYNDYSLGISEIDDFRQTVTSNAWLHVKR